MITMETMADAARQLKAAEEASAAAEAALKEAKEKERQLREESVPALFEELGISELKLDDGSKFSVKQDVYVSIPAANKAAVFKWLEDNDYGGLIKTEVSVPFGKGELDSAIKLMDDLASEFGVTSAKLDRSVHAQTMAAFMRERLANPDEGPQPDLDLFGARPVSVAKVELPKAKKSKYGGGVAAVMHDCE